jgi:hypothetical protein
MGSLLKLGAVNVTDALASPAVTVSIVGAVAGPLVDAAADAVNNI